jgi:hypothetical protein
VPVGTRAHRGEHRRRWLALCFAVLLAIAPFTRSSSTVHLAAVADAYAESVAVYDDGIAQTSQPAAGLRPAQPLALGILSRPPLLETPLGLPPVKPPLIQPDAFDEPPGAIQATVAFGGETGRIFHRSSVGTARTPTGPPA